MIRFSSFNKRPSRASLTKITWQTESNAGRSTSGQPKCRFLAKNMFGRTTAGRILSVCTQNPQIKSESEGNVPMSDSSQQIVFSKASLQRAGLS
jgi:hypothetical protein